MLTRDYLKICLAFVLRRIGCFCIMRFRRIRWAILIGVSILMTVFCLQALFFTVQHKMDLYLDSPSLKHMGQVACHHPELDLMNPSIRKHIHDVGELQCNTEKDWVLTENGTVFVNSDIAKRRGKIYCKITYIERVDDFNTKLGKTQPLTSDDKPIKLEEDFFMVKCKADDTESWKNVMAAIHKNETLLERLQNAKAPENSMKLNVLIYGLDSMSRMHFIRKLPKTYSYLKDVLKASVLKGYNIVGDGTPQALIPILTGSTESELPETRKRIKGATYVDVYPFAWKNFSSSGYVTAWGEEQPHVGTFTYRLKGFKDLPTDHCMRSFYLKINKVMQNHPKLCLGNKPRHRLMLDWLQQFFDVYPNVPKFGFCFNSELSHDDYNIIGYADGDIESFLKDMHDTGILNNTLLIVMSDHGHRFAPIRATQQGKQEERLPFFSFVLPYWMETKYPAYVRNLKINEDRLVTPFDIHATLMTLLNPNVPLRGDANSRSISLFSEIPEERSCTSASIEPHWCACLAWSQISLKDDITNKVAQAVVDFMNSLTQPQRTKCEELQLAKVTRIEKLIPNKDFLTFKKNADTDGRYGDFSDHTQVTEITYQVQITTSPGGGIYEAIVKYSSTDGTFSVNEHELSRVNMYGDQEHCIHDEFPGLRKYCYCRIQLGTS